MQLPNKCIIFFAGAWLFVQSIALAADISFNPAESGVGARSLALGKAFAGLANDASAIFINPAGLSSQKGLQLISMYSQLFDDNTYLVAGAANSYPFGTVGIGYISVASPNIEIIEFIGGVPTVVDYTSFGSSLLLLAYSRRLSDKLQLGANFKVFSQGYSGGGATYEALSGRGINLDLGIKFKPQAWLSLGASAQNFLPASWGGKFVWRVGVEENIPSIVKAGLAAKILGDEALRKWGRGELALLIDFDRLFSSQSSLQMGIEFQPVFPFTLRLGSDNGKIAAGIGFSYADVTFDYAYRKIDSGGENISHAFSVGYVAGRVVEAVAARKKEKEERKTGLLVFTDIPGDYFAREAIEKMTALGIISGFADGTFKPKEKITRAELAMWLVRSSGVKIPEISQRVFKDVPQDHWSADYVKAAVDQEWITGYADGTFRPNWPVTREEVAAVLSRFDKFPEFIPGEKVTRAEIAEMLFRTRLVQAKIREKGD